MDESSGRNPSLSCPPAAGSRDEMDRRRFIQTLTAWTAVGSGWGMAGSQWVLGEVTTPDHNLGYLQVRIADHPNLQVDFGSIRVGTTAVTGDRPLFYPVLVTRVAPDIFHAVSAECTHEGCILPPLNRATQRATCPCHGSRFLADGSVVPGSVARQPLRSFVVRRDTPGILTIELPEMAVALRPVRAFSSPRRIELEFIAFEGVRYELRTRARLTDPGVVAPFSLTPDGPLSRTVLPGFGDFARIYADLSSEVGFYSVVMQVEVV